MLYSTLLSAFLGWQCERRTVERKHITAVQLSAIGTVIYRSVIQPISLIATLRPESRTANDMQLNLIRLLRFTRKFKQNRLLRFRYTISPTHPTSKTKLQPSSSLLMHVNIADGLLLGLHERPKYVTNISGRNRSVCDGSALEEMSSVLRLSAVPIDIA